MAPFALRISPAFATPAAEPAMTVCSGELKFAAETTSPEAAGRLGARLDDLLGGQADHGRHRAPARRHGFLHERAAPPHEDDGVLERERARGDERRVLAERVAGGDGRDDASRFQHGEDGDGVREDRGLRDGRLLEVLVRPLERHRRDDEAERSESRVRARVNLPGLGKPLDEVLPHPGELGALPREEEGDPAHGVTSGRGRRPTSGRRRTP